MALAQHISRHLKALWCQDMAESLVKAAQLLKRAVLHHWPTGLKKDRAQSGRKTVPNTGPGAPIAAGTCPGRICELPKVLFAKPRIVPRIIIIIIIIIIMWCNPQLSRCLLASIFASLRGRWRDTYSSREVSFARRQLFFEPSMGQNWRLWYNCCIIIVLHTHQTAQWCWVYHNEVGFEPYSHAGLWPPDHYSLL